MYLIEYFNEDGSIASAHIVTLEDAYDIRFPCPMMARTIKFSDI